MEHQGTFDKLKNDLVTAPSLVYPDFIKKFILQTDASLKGLGAILSQQGNDGRPWVTAYASRLLQPSEIAMRNYSSAKLELLVLKWAITENSKTICSDQSLWSVQMITLHYIASKYFFLFCYLCHMKLTFLMNNHQYHMHIPTPCQSTINHVSHMAKKFVLSNLCQ